MEIPGGCNVRGIPRAKKLCVRLCFLERACQFSALPQAPVAVHFHCIAAAIDTSVVRHYLLTTERLGTVAALYTFVAGRPDLGHGATVCKYLIHNFEV